MTDPAFIRWLEAEVAFWKVRKEQTESVYAYLLAELALHHREVVDDDA